MNLIDVSWGILAAVLAALLAVLIVLRGFVLPRNFQQKQEQRAALRRRLMEKDYQQRQVQMLAQDADRAGMENSEEPAGNKNSSLPPPAQ